jgi:hypothetical protein
MREERSCTVQVQAALSALGDGEVLQDLGLERSA